MALYYNLPVYRDTYRLLLRVFGVTQSFSREYRYTLGQDMKHDAMRLVRSIYRANREPSRRHDHLEVFLDDLELLKLEIRLCLDIKILTVKKIAELSKLLDSIGKQVTGWRNVSGSVSQNR